MAPLHILIKVSSRFENLKFYQASLVISVKPQQPCSVNWCLEAAVMNVKKLPFEDSNLKQKPCLEM